MPWVRFDDGFDDHPKVAELFLLAEDDLLAHAALGLHMLALTYCGRKMTNGEVGRALPSKLRGTQAQVDLLVAAELWEVAEVARDGWLIHDFLDYNPSREETEAARAELSQKRSEAGKRGAEARWGDGKNGKRKASPKQRDSPEPEPEPGTAKMDSASPSSVERPEVVMLCELMADAIEAQGVDRRPNPHTKKWHDATRRLLDLDGASVKQVEYAIRWTTSHTFWTSVVRSMPKLREKWGAIALQIRQEKEGIRRTGGSPRDRAGDDMRELQRIADEQRARGE